MAAKCAYVEKVGGVYYVRKRIPRAWKGGAEGEVLRLSLRTKDRAQALNWSLEALVQHKSLRYYCAVAVQGYAEVGE